MANSPIVVFARLQAKPGMGGKVREALEACTPGSRAEPANHGYDMHVTIGNDDEVTMHELWDSQAALDEHTQSPHFKTAAEALKTLLASPMTVSVTRRVT